MRCGKFCRRWPQLVGSMMHWEIAGTICVGHTSMGSRWVLLDDAVLPLLVWAAMVSQIHPHCVLHECTPAFQESMLQHLLGPDFRVQSVVFSPCDLGIPSERQRRYSLCTYMPTIRQKLALNTFNFSKYCFRTMTVDGNIYFMSSHEELLKMKKTLWMRVNPGADAEDIDFNDIPWRQCLTDADRQRLEEHTTILEADFLGLGGKCAMVNIGQSTSFQNCITCVMPTLLRKSLIWRIVMVDDVEQAAKGSCIRVDVRRGRPLMPLEHLAVQGVPLPSDVNVATEACNPLRAVLHGGHLGDADIRSLAGNAMHIAAVGSMIAFGLMTVSRR